LLSISREQEQRSLPTWNTAKSGYSFGINEPTGDAPWEGAQDVPSD